MKAAKVHHRRFRLRLIWAVYGGRVHAIKAHAVRRFASWANPL